MSRILFDKPRLNEMQEFLNYLYIIGIQNPNISINDGLVYRELCKYKLGSDEIDPFGNVYEYHDMFDKWIERNKEVDSYKKGLVLEYDNEWPHFIQYYSKGDYWDFFQKHDYIKLYIPIKQENLFESVNVLFDFIRDSNIKHISKVSDKMRVDNVVIRLNKDDLYNAIKIINFIQNDNAIRNNLGIINPFVPSINGIGFMYESNISYNSEMALLISKYINNVISLNMQPTIKDFYTWFKGNNSSCEIDNIFSYSVGEKKVIDDEVDNITDYNKQRLFIDAIKATFLKYDINQVMLALKLLLEKEDYSSFTNGSGKIKYRQKLRSQVSKDDAIRYIENYLSEDSEINYDTVLYYCKNIFKEELLKELCEALYITYQNNGLNHCKVAINEMVKNNNARYFSRYSKDDFKHEKNYRKIIANYDKNGILNLMKLLLDINKVDYDNENTNEIIDKFINCLINLNYLKQESIRK